MAKTAKPTGLKLTRNGKVFTLQWKIGDVDYGDGQSVQYRTSASTSWKALTVGKTATSKAITCDNANYYPNKKSGKVLPLLSWVEMRVRGNRKKYTNSSGKVINPTVSDWSVKRYTVGHPRLPSLTATVDEELSNRCKFTWSTTTSATDAYWFTDVEWQTILVKESNVTDGSKLKWNSSQLGWQTGTSVANSYRNVTEDTMLLASNSYTRWFRVRSRGVAGVSINSSRKAVWRYAKHVYGFSYQAKIKSAVATVQAAGGFQCKVVWEATATNSHPIDKTTVEYATAVPEAGMQCPDDVSWTAGNVSADTGWNDAAVFPIDRLLSEDQCLFVRVNTEHDNVITYGLPYLATGGVGILAEPTLTRIDEGDNYIVTVTATNNSEVTDSFLVVLYKPASNPSEEIVIGTIPYGSSSESFQAPDWSGETAHAFGVYAAVGDPDTITRDNAKMKSTITWGSGDVPQAPTNVRVSATDITGTIRVEWDWTWSEADGAELSWSDHEDAWESTDQPETFEIPNNKNSRWNISGLETGMKWYVKVRLFKGEIEDATFGAYSGTAVIDLTSAPSIPSLVLSESVITEEGSVTASWVYTTTDGTAQVYAEICEAEITSEGIEYGDIIAHTETAQHITISAEDAGWQTGETYNLCVRVVSASGRVSDEWSSPVSVAVAEPLEIEVTDVSLVEDEETIIVDDEEVTREFLSLTEMPLSITVTGASESGTTTVAIERSVAYYLDRPDESMFAGYEGETIALHSQTGEEPIVISDLIGSLDDGASYKIVATIQDELGQRSEKEIEFEVHWTHQALIPDGTVVLDENDLIAKITPVAPTGALETDVCDIYRLSVDRPQLVVQGGTFGETYVDPYPTLGQFGGYRVVFRTANGDYITAENQLAWVDLTDEIFDADYAIIDFDGGQILLRYNVDSASSWSKDFQETKYLGGSIQGDWNPAVSRTTDMSSIAITITDADDIETIHRLASTPTQCHVRTKDGASFAADVQVSESYSHDKYGKIASYTFTITKIDTQELDGVTLQEWEKVHDELE